MRRVAVFILLITSVQAGLPEWCRSADPLYEYYAFYSTDADGHDYPHNGAPSWGDDGDLTQGLAHDADNWYIVSLGKDFLGFADGNFKVSRVPVSEALWQVFDDNPNVRVVEKNDIAELADMLLHAGDPDCFRHNDVDYLFVPVYCLAEPDSFCNGLLASVVVFRADDLHCMGTARLPGQDKTGWCAVSPDGILFSSEHQTEVLRQYSIDWDKMMDPSLIGSALDPLNPVRLHHYDGGPVPLRHMQGGEFSPSGEKFYVNCGVWNEEHPESDGLWMFNANTWTAVTRSFNRGFYYIGCVPHWLYRYSTGFEAKEEPEGLTIWDLDDGRAPHVRGQLHVVLYNHNTFTTNRVYLKHYTDKIYVDWAAEPPPDPRDPGPLGPPMWGSEVKPFNSLENALHWNYGQCGSGGIEWDGVKIVMRGGSYPENGRVVARVQLSATDGAVRIGD